MVVVIIVDNDGKNRQIKKKINNDDDNKEEPQTNDRLPARGTTRQPRSAARTHRVAGEALGGDEDYPGS